MDKIWVIDGHCDSIGDYANGKRNLCNPLDGGHWDIERAKKGQVGLQFMASFIETEYKPFKSTMRGLELINATLNFVASNKEHLFLVTCRKDLQSLPVENKIGILMSVEGGEILGDALFMVDIIYSLGVRALGLTWNQRNAIADGVGEQSSQSRLTHFGEKVIDRLNELGMLIDVSHLNEQGFWHVLERSKQPIIASHSCAKALCNHPRNLSNEQIKAIAKNNGVIGINFYPRFLNESGNAGVEDVIRHIGHICDIAGIDVVGLGSDFDGIDTTPESLNDASFFQFLGEALVSAGYKIDDIRKLFHGNFRRLLNDVLK